MNPVSVPYHVAVTAAVEIYLVTPLLILEHWATTMESLEQAASETLAA